jgi:hypothetical protein
MCGQPNLLTICPLSAAPHRIHTLVVGKVAPPITVGSMNAFVLLGSLLGLK